MNENEVNYLCPFCGKFVNHGDDYYAVAWHAKCAGADWVAARSLMLRTLKELEWILSVGNVRWCPSCYHDQAAGHKRNCHLAAALKGMQ